MSLIQDALKRKTEEHNLPDAPPSEQPVQSAKPPKNPAPPATPPPTPATEVPAADSSGKKLFIILAVIITLVLLLIGAGIFISTSHPVVLFDVVETETAAQTEPPTPVSSVAPAVAAPAPPPVAAPKPATAAQDWPDLSYSGSAIGGNQILAVINGRMLSVGNRIKGVKVLQIGKNEVLVEFNGETRVLHIDDE